MRTDDDYPCVVSGRITQRAKALMGEYGFNVRDAVEWFVDTHCNPKKRLEIDIYELEKEINELEFKLSIKKSALDNLKKELDAL